MSFENAASEAETETLANPIRVRGLWLYLLRFRLLLNGRRMGHVATEFLPEDRCIVRINLHVIASTGDRDIGHAAVEHILRAQFSVDVNQDTISSLSLAGVAGHGIAAVEMRMLGRVEFNCAATVHPQVQAPDFVVAFDGSQLAKDYIGTLCTGGFSRSAGRAQQGSSDGASCRIPGEIEGADRYRNGVETRVPLALGVRGCPNSTLPKSAKYFEILVSAAGLEPATHALKGHCSTN